MSARLALLLAALLAVLASAPVAGALAGVLGWPGSPFDGARLASLAAQHLLLVIGGAGPAVLVGVAVGVWVTRPEGAGRALRPLADAGAAAAQAVPPVVVVALAFPALGFGAGPTLLALGLYALMPVLRATIAAIEALPADAPLAARALGMTEREALRDVVLSLAWPALLPGVRSAVLLATATAAVGSLAGAATLGTPIILGLQTMNGLLIWQGAAATAALAFLCDAVLAALERRAVDARAGRCEAARRETRA
jgi:osmoprotectant transport system permease protein